MKLKELDKFIESNNLLLNVKEQPGVYAITIDNCIVYVGQSKNVRQRCSQHIYNIENATFNQEKKYLLLLAAKLGGHKIDYISLEYCKEEDLREREDLYIKLTQSPLNILTPDGKQDISNLTIGDLMYDIKKRREAMLKELGIYEES